MIFGTEPFPERKHPYRVIKGDLTENADVCIIGTGAAGAILAKKLSEAGKKVVVLEAGGYYDGEDFNQREADMMPLLWKQCGLVFTNDMKIPIAQGSCLGGSTVINDAVCFPTPRIVLEDWEQLGVSKELTEGIPGAVEEVYRELRVSRVTEEELNKNNLKLKEGCERLGYKAEPNERNSVNCRQCGFCHLGCHYDTKQSMLITYIPKALKHRAKFYCNCTADKVNVTNGKVDSVEGSFLDRSGVSSNRIRVNSKAVIISAGAIASSQILLKSKINEDRAGIGLTLHPAASVIAEFDEEINAHRGIPMAYSCYEFGVPNGFRKGYMVESVFLPIFQFAVAFPAFGIEHELLMEKFTHYAMAGIMIRDDPNGRVRLGQNGTAIIEYDLNDDGRKGLADGLKTGSRIFFAAGAKSILTSHREKTLLHGDDDLSLIDARGTGTQELMLASAHPQGGNRMGEDPASCVVNSHCIVHGVDGLYVCDASVFPTAVGVNPQITVMAIATLTANHINAHWPS